MDNLKIKRVALFACVAAALLSTPSWAVTGREAVGQCIDNREKGLRCEFSVNKKGEIDICNKNGCVYCESAEAQCTMARYMPGMVFEPGQRGAVEEVAPDRERQQRRQMPPGQRPPRQQMPPRRMPPENR